MSTSSQNSHATHNIPISTQLQQRNNQSPHQPLCSKQKLKLSQHFNCPPNIRYGVDIVAFLMLRLHSRTRTAEPGYCTRSKRYWLGGYGYHIAVSVDIMRLRMQNLTAGKHLLLRNSTKINCWHSTNNAKRVFIVLLGVPIMQTHPSFQI